MMHRPPVRALLCVSLPALMLAACGGVPEEAGLAPPEEPLGTREAAVCSGLSVTSLTLSGISTYQGEMAGSGNWAVSTFANAVWLEYYVDGVRSSTTKKLGTSGTWSFSASGIPCGSHSFEVRAYPMVVASDGSETTCWSSYKSLSQTVSENCSPITTSFSCVRSSTTTLKCTGSASGGSGSFTPYWQETWNSWPDAWYSGAWTQSFYCQKLVLTPCSPDQPCEQAPTEQLKISFKAIDSAGTASAVSSSVTYTCAM
jgi:hypothetical protein